MPSDDTGFAPLRAKSDEGPVFEQAWHAQVLAVANALAEAGVFSRSQWSDALGAALRERQDASAAVDEDGYYQSALAALERLVSEHGGVESAEVSERTQAWRAAYLRTPHGEPVELS